MVVRPRDDRFELVTGCRRYAALHAAQCTHALVGLCDLDEQTAAALYAAENYLVDGLSPNAIDHLAQKVSERPEFVRVLAMIAEMMRR